MTRRDRIVVLLEHYRDVVYGLEDHEADSVFVHGLWEQVIPAMCRAWNHPSYQQLERLRGELARVEPRLNAHLMGRYYGYSERFVARCRKCGQMAPAKRVGAVHGRCRVKGKLVTLQPHIERVVSPAVNPKFVEAAVDWLDAHWQGSCKLPSDVAAIERERELRKVAA